jgi:hypothetical protein
MGHSFNLSAMNARIVSLKDGRDGRKYGYVVIERTFGPVVSEVAGWMKLTDNATQDQEFELPNDAHVAHKVDSNGYERLILS